MTPPQFFTLFNRGNTTKKAPPDVRQRLRCCCIQFTRRDVACQARGGKIAPLYKAHPKSDRKV
ncbi:hypothetical protein DW651_14560 [Subdoligranulum sp. AM23-21AC]|uniref:Uncharacterized protein n=1 Tax=Ruthenibacterium lactatiformans TaxID=1550024 RepID=A0A0D8IVR5_9FIRM|nr:hypothetical protein TQ39_16145 [Ruthenibacterium lactatiformans]RGD00311.1 hypothetical protein DW194_02805 [Subdoligranulum sp. AM16-9]RGD19029.1 hypothetical protein DW651_14560 [Subdoligranulum sp. AM23-21AC]RJW04169.1 hypothetical protein DWW15_01040 [Subdoligranulum sp. AF14-43]RJW32473.1 hypothetical protein DXC43_06315 [Subdoligranulum sp. TF05-17AC]RJW81087.1 hypothetical protein DXA32_11930 [Subdoligranulum sp. OF01-18]